MENQQQPNQQPPEEEPEDVVNARRMFYGGFAFLPFLWFVNWLYFKPILKHPSCSPDIRWYAKWSLIGFVVFMTVWIIWLIVFYTNMHGWAESLLLFDPDTATF